MLILVLAVLVAIFGRIETPGARRPQTQPRWMPVWLNHWLIQPGPRVVLTVAGYAAAVYGLLANNAAAQTGHELVGMPTAALVAFLPGAAALRLLRAVPANRR